ncbi:DUF6011 domain-containing protein [Allonocardiopsis opalescens]|uniref:SWIM-type domain-containing protein n=1 Tax=Allonocardiopsis opalescens TaxID=1144618 RepID=A0A2T0PST2_9ACTN|nr:DUF6011 domain-containing protein [Allonocardiopsis opalescens]PRX91952.1 hypothetical protein CLV72_11225 [Allonocardiopsis opalescens]
MTTTPASTPRCLRCGRPLTSAASIARGYGKGCASLIRRAAVVADLDGFKSSQVDSAREAVADGAVLLLRGRVHQVVSSDGAHVHLATVEHCSCPAGLRGVRCWHIAAVRIVASAGARPVLTLVRPPIAVPSVTAQTIAA